MGPTKQKSYFLNIYFITGITLFLGFIVAAFIFHNMKTVILPGTEGIPFAKPDYTKLFFGNNASGKPVYFRVFKAIISDSFIILSAWLIGTLLSVLLGYLSSKLKWLGSGIKEILGFGPTIVLAAILVYIIDFKIYGVAVAMGLGFVPYLTAKFSVAFEKNEKPYIYYYTIHSVFIAAVIVQFGGYFGLFSGKFISIGNELRTNFSYAFKYFHLFLPYAIASFALIIFPSLMIRGIKNAHVYNKALKSKEEEILAKTLREKEIESSKPSEDYFEEEPVGEIEVIPEDEIILEETELPSDEQEITESEEQEVTDREETDITESKEKDIIEGEDITENEEKEIIEHEKKTMKVETSKTQTDKEISEVKLYDWELNKEEIFSNCFTIGDIEKRFTDYLVFQYDYSRACLYEVRGHGFLINSLHIKTIPSELIDIEKENDDFMSKAYKFDFLRTLIDKSTPYFIYPGKDNYDRIFHHLLVNGNVKYIIEISFNKATRNETEEIRRLKKIIPFTEGAMEDALAGKLPYSSSEEEKEDEKETAVLTKDSEDEDKADVSATEKHVVLEEDFGQEFDDSKEVSNSSGLKPVDTRQTGDEILTDDVIIDSCPPEEEDDKDKNELEKSIQIDDEEEIEEYPETETDSYGEDIDIFLDFEVDTTSTGFTSAFSDDTIYSDEIELEEPGEGIFVTRFEDKLGKGLRCLRNKEFDRALLYLKDASALNPSSHQAYMALGHVFRHKGLFNEALEYYRKALQYNRFSSNAYNYIGNIMYKLKKYKLAVQSWQRAYNLDPGRTLIRKNVEKLKKIIDKTA